MRRFGRWIFNGLTVLSLVSLILFLLVWMQSFRVQTQASLIFIPRTGTTYLPSETSSIHTLVSQQVWWVNVNCGVATICWQTLGCASGKMPNEDPGFSFRRMPAHSPDTEWEMELGRVVDYQYGGVCSHLVMECWPMAILFSLAPLAWLVQRVVRKPSRYSGKCRNCGYDLRATPERCPECGTVAQKIVQAE
jgi:hypothetical protein